MPLQQEILQALRDISDDHENAGQLREQYAEALATAIKNALRTWIGQGTPIAQDGGAGLKTTLT